MNTWKQLWEWIRSILIAIILALFIRVFLLEVFIVEGRSMYPTLIETERLLANKLAYRFGEPQRGDIVVFEYRPDQNFIKRVVGLSGDQVEIINERVYLNGQVLDEPYLPDNVMMQNFGPVEVPPSYIFVMGDYRHNSMDSRDPRVGFVSLDDLKGQVFYVFWPPWVARSFKNTVE